MAAVVMFATARQISGAASCGISGDTVADVLRTASSIYGERFSEVLSYSRIWLNGQPVDRDSDRACNETDELAVLPPIAGG